MQGVRRGLRTIRAGLMAGVCLGAAAAAHAGDATWSAAPPNNNWNDGANWTSIPPHAVPDGTASFGESTQRSIVFSSNFTSIGNLNFSATAPAYTYTIVAGQGFVVIGTGTVDLQGAGGGIVNNSAFAPTFVLTGALAGMSFNNFATAANANFNITGGGNLQFFNNAGAAASITNSSGGSTSFFNNSSASSPIKPGQAVVGSTIVNNSGGTSHSSTPAMPLVRSSPTTTADRQNSSTRAQPSVPPLPITTMAQRFLAVHLGATSPPRVISRPSSTIPGAKPISMRPLPLAKRPSRTVAALQTSMTRVWLRMRP